MKKIRVEKLTEEAFAPFGSVLEIEGREFEGEEGMFEWYEKQASVKNAKEVSINLLKAIERDFVCQKFEFHLNTTETILPLTCGLIVAGIPVGDAAIERVRAFYVPVGKGICWSEGTWHYAPYPIGDDAICAIIFRHGTGSDDAQLAMLPEPLGFDL